MPDPLIAAASAPWPVRYLVNVLYQADCLVACMLTGARNKTISCWCGEAEDGLLGRGWYWGLIWLWLPVNFIARTLFGQKDHCAESVGPFLVEEDRL